MSCAELAVTFKGSLSILYLSPPEEKLSFCCPQQLTGAISVHKGCHQCVTHSLSSRTHPWKQPAGGLEQGEPIWMQNWDWNDSKEVQLVLPEWPNKRWGRAEESPIALRVSHYPAVNHHHQSAQREATATPAPFLALAPSHFIKSNQHKSTDTERMMGTPNTDEEGESIKARDKNRI